MRQLKLSLTALAAASLLAACGGGSNTNVAAPALPPLPERGTLVETPVVLATLTAAQIDAGTAASGLQALSGRARCDVKVVSLNYNTIGPKTANGVTENTNVSGVMLVPTGTGAGCTAAAPLVANARGTEVSKTRALANPNDPETFLLIAMYAAQGYAVTATDYLGFAKSSYGFHPYLHADSQATSVIDSIRAARNAAGVAGATLSGRVMVVGYSQGGHASMAAHRAIEKDLANEINVVGGAHLAGPYNLSGSLRLQDAIAGVQFFNPFIVTSWQKVYGNIYSDVNAVFKAPYATGIESLLPSPTLTYTTLVTTGRLPGALGETPNQARDALFQPGFVSETRTNTTNGLAIAARANDLFGWNPRARTLLCGGAGDPTVPPAVHQAPMKADFDSRGVTTVTSVDVDPSIRAIYGINGQAPTPAAPAAFATYFGNYHGQYAPPLCHAAAKASFDAVR